MNQLPIDQKSLPHLARNHSPDSYSLMNMCALLLVGIFAFPSSATPREELVSTIVPYSSFHCC